MIAADDPLRQWKLAQVERAVAEHTRRLDAQLSQEARDNLMRMKLQAKAATRAAQEAASAAETKAEAEAAMAAATTERPRKRARFNDSNLLEVREFVVDDGDIRSLAEVDDEYTNDCSRTVWL